MSRTHIKSDRLFKGSRLSCCGMYRRTPEMPRNQGNLFEWAESASVATCQLCRMAVGLPKTIALYEPELVYEPGKPMTEVVITPPMVRTVINQEVGPAECWTPGEGWSETPRTRFQLPTGPVLSPVEAKHQIRRAIAECGGSHHMLLVRQKVDGRPPDADPTVNYPPRWRIGALRRPKPTFVSEDYPTFAPGWDIGSATKGPVLPIPKTALDRLLGDDVL